MSCLRCLWDFLVTMSSPPSMNLHPLLLTPVVKPPLLSPALWDSPSLGSRRPGTVRPGTLDPGHLQAMFSPTKAQPRLFLLFKNSISFYEPVMMWLTTSC